MNMFSDMKFIKMMAALLAGLMCVTAYAATDGKWKQTPDGLPYYEYASSPSDEDPYFLLGNYRINLHTHVNGIYELISGERVWARFNADPERPGYGRNRAELMVDKSSYELVGNGSLATDPSRCDVSSGIGFTRYDYRMDDGISCSRMISVMPSEDVYHGNPCFLLTVTLSNNGKKTREVTYDEIVIPYFEPMYAQRILEEKRAFSYPFRTAISFRCVSAVFTASPQQYFQSYSTDSPFIHEVAPVPMFVYSPDAFLSIYDGEIHAKMQDLKIRSGETLTFRIIIGASGKDVKISAEDMLSKAKDGQFGAYAYMWKNVLPDYSSESDAVTRSELYWNAHVIEASAMYDDYFGETFVPSGSKETYDLGLNASNSRHIEAALAASHINPPLAKSIIRYVMKHSDSNGEIASGNTGYGFALPADNHDVRHQILVFNAVAEYLRMTGDYAFLDERISLYPKDGNALTVMQLLEKYYIRLRDLPVYDHGTVLTEASMLAVSLPVLASELKNSRRASSGFVTELESFAKYNEERFLSSFTPSGSGLNDIVSCSYYMQMDDVPVADRRQCYNELDATDLELEYPILLGLASFDEIEAMKLFRKLSFETMTRNHPEIWDVWQSEGYSTRPHCWPLYLYARIHE